MEPYRTLVPRGIPQPPRDRARRRPRHRASDGPQCRRAGHPHDRRHRALRGRRTMTGADRAPLRVRRGRPRTRDRLARARSASATLTSSTSSKPSITRAVRSTAFPCGPWPRSTPNPARGFVAAVGDPALRERAAAALTARGLEPVALVHPRAEVAPERDHRARRRGVRRQRALRRRAPRRPRGREPRLHDLARCAHGRVRDAVARRARCRTRRHRAAGRDRNRRDHHQRVLDAPARDRRGRASSRPGPPSSAMSRPERRSAEYPPARCDRGRPNEPAHRPHLSEVAVPELHGRRVRASGTGSEHLPRHRIPRRRPRIRCSRRGAPRVGHPRRGRNGSASRA